MWDSRPTASPQLPTTSTTMTSTTMTTTTTSKFSLQTNFFLLSGLHFSQKFSRRKKHIFRSFRSRLVSSPKSEDARLNFFQLTSARTCGERLIEISLRSNAQGGLYEARTKARIQRLVPAGFSISIKSLDFFRWLVVFWPNPSIIFGTRLDNDLAKNFVNEISSC